MRPELTGWLAPIVAKIGLRTVVTVKETGRNKPEPKSLCYPMGWLWLQIIACQMKVVHISYCFHSCRRMPDRNNFERRNSV